MMFDYQAGEKFKLTLIMVGFAGLMAGMLFTMLFMPPSTQQPRRHHHLKYEMNPDVTGQATQDGAAVSQPAQAADTTPSAAARQAATQVVVSASDALGLINAWLPLSWDLSAASAKNSQEKAIMYMTPECAQAYRQNIWTADIAQQITQSGLQTTFNANKVAAGQPQADGSIVIYVDGVQTLSVPGKGTEQRPIKYEYLVKLTADGLRIAGISEGGGQS